ncbi:phosphoesterase [Ventosimonas gracilis]|uniref:Phosphoesterase n=1 Tax=Ventosimonas gracilis TaxID=1680762 RepID=A0A139SQN4_9GAMM|nr:bifunctional DedA family/phosphatase PAP2 family protein [Ventosimonas gracilis]KXU36761.1 phosphoesterase [Ventosimonas gracilis]
MGDFLTTASVWLEAHPQWLGLALFIVACAECLAIVGLLMPGTVLLFAIAVMAGSGALGLGETLLLGFLGGLLGDLLSYGLGFRFKHRIGQLPGLRTHPQWLASTERYFQRFGAVSLLIGRYIGPLRPLLPMVAGMLRMPFWRFALISLLAGTGWSIAYLLPGWATGAALRLPLPDGFWRDAALLLASLGLLLAISLYSSQRGLRHSSLITAGLCLLALITLSLGFSHLQSLDNGLMNLIQAHRSKTLDTAAILITGLGNSLCQIVIGLLLITVLLLFKQWRAFCFSAAALLGTAVASELLKQLIQRARPDLLLQPLSSFSLPSGHSASSMAFYGCLAVLAGRGQPPRWRLVWLLLASLPVLFIACSRVYLGVHWPTDIIAGVLLSGVFCAGALAFVQYRSPLPALPARFWQILLPLALFWLATYAFWTLPQSIARYSY